MKPILLLLFFLVLQTAVQAQVEEADAVTTVQKELTIGITVTGRVQDAVNDQLLAGINVSVPGYSSAITQNDGTFSIQVPALEATIVLTGTGFQYREVALRGRSEITVALFEQDFNSAYDKAFVPEERPLNQVPQAAVSLSLKDNWQRNTETLDNYLQGNVVGVNIIRRSGTPGIGAEILARGFSSLNATNKPLVVVDGMIYDMNEYGVSLSSGYFSNPFAFIDLRDVDNITFIKDATSQYGSKAANGVIVITTAKAKELATRLDFGVSTGIGLVPKSRPVMNAANYRLYLNDLLKSQGLTDGAIAALPYMNDDPASADYYTYHNNTSWQKKVFNNASTQDYYLKITGGDNIARYALSLGYADQAGIVSRTGLKRSSVRFNADFDITQRLTASTNMAYTNNENTLRDQAIADRTNPVFLSLVKAPILAAHVRGGDGSTSPNIAEEDVFGISNPLAAIRNVKETNRANRFFGAVNFNYKLSDDITVASLFGITYDKVRETLFYPRKGIVADTLENALAESTMGLQNQQLLSFYNDTRISYTKRFNYIHQFSAAGGMRFQTNKLEQDYVFGYNSPTDDYQTIGTGETALRQNGGDIGKWVWLSFYANINYDLLNKYFLTYSMAVDGSSRFGDEIPGSLKLFGNRFGIFPSIAGAWLISSENFMQDIPLVDLLKLRASYGLTGNDDIGNYNASLLYGVQNFLGYQGVVRKNISNSALKWETSRKLNLGVDIGFLNERFRLSIDVYKNIINDLLTAEPASPLSGWEYSITNSGKMQNKGIEVAINSRAISTNAFQWDVGLTIASNKNEVTQLPQDELTYQYAGATILTRTGHPANLFYGYKAQGIYATNEEATAAGLKTKLSNGELINFQGGDVRFVDQNGDKEINDSDRVIIGDPNPDFTGMLSNRLVYKQFVLDAAIAFTHGNDVYNYTRMRLGSASGYENQDNSVANRWSVNGQQTSIPRVNYGDPLQNARFSDRWIEDGSYIRLRNISITYNIPVQSRFLKYASVYCTGNNLMTITNYKGYDPEFSEGSNLFNQGIDVGMVPQNRSVIIGVRVGL